MASYAGPDEISGGGSYVEENGLGGEIWNFDVEDGLCYGYVMTKPTGEGLSGVDVSRLSSVEKWGKGDELDGVTVVFVARKPGLGQVVVGWYRNATIFHKHYKVREADTRLPDVERVYLCQTRAENSFLVPHERRDFSVPSAQKDGEGFIGQSHVWYPDESKPGVGTFVDQLRRYMAGYERELAAAAGVNEGDSPARGKTGFSPVDKDVVLQIERNSVGAVMACFEEKGYRVKSVERDNLGWDLEAEKGNERLLIEVKGHLGAEIRFELTPNEYAMLQEKQSSYRVCVVRNALEASEVETYAPVEKEGVWHLKRTEGKGLIRLSEKVAARASEMDA